MKQIIFRVLFFSLRFMYLALCWSGATIGCTLFLFFFAKNDAWNYKKLFIGLGILNIFYLVKVQLKKMLMQKMTNQENHIEFLKFYQFINFLFIIFVDPITIFLIFYIWDVNLILILKNNVRYVFLYKLFYCLILSVLLKTFFLLSDLFIRILIDKKQEEFKNRFATLAKILNVVFKIILSSIFTLIIFFIYEIDSTPIFANFWILTAGLSFSLQSLMKDLAIGVIMMFEDAVRIGDEVEISGISGEVEEITLRILKIRDAYGSLISIPFNKVEMISNKSRKYIYVVFNVMIDIHSNTQKALELMYQAGVELKNSPDFKKKLFLSDIKISGPLEVSANGILCEAKIKVTPCKPKLLLGAYYSICKKLFDSNSIKFSKNLVKITIKNI